jgi:hypothetical protein
MIPPDLSVDAVLLANAIVPELFADQQPVYLIDAADLGRPVPETCAAYCQLTAKDVAIRDHLIAANRWQGHGTALVFDLAAIEQSTCDLRATFLAILLHESAHAVLIRPAVPEPDNEPSNLRRMAHETTYRTFANSPTATRDEHHGAEFIRVLGHLWFRSACRGIVCNFGEMFSPWVYGRDLHAYVEALGDEPDRLRDATFAEIRATEAPAAFSKLWTTDSERLNDERNRV